MSYVLGYVLKKLSISCATCSSYLLYKSDFLSESNQVFTYIKAVTTSKRDFCGLTVPSEMLVQSFESVHSPVIIPFLSDMTNFIEQNLNPILTMCVVSKLSHL